MNMLYQKSEMVEIGYTHGSVFMLKVTNEVRREICKTCWWVQLKDNCYLVMYKAGGHGTKDTIYTNNW